ncbi:MAG: hypothetical protein ACHP9T_09760 [Caulobacterales bacterium]|jgi:hypothetical protein
MKKPVNPIAAIFVVGGVLLVIGDYQMARAIGQMMQIAYSSPGNGVPLHQILFVSFWREISAAFVRMGLVVGIGVVIELVDQIRWNAMPAEERRVRRPIRDGMARLRRWTPQSPTPDRLP